MKAALVAASAALIGSVAASAHRAHAGLHRRHAPPAEQACAVVTTTVYVTASPVPAPAPPQESSAIAYSPAPAPLPETTSEKPVAPSSSKAEYAPPPAPTSEAPVSKVEYTPPPAPTSETSAPPPYAPAPPSEKPVPTSSKAAEEPKPSKNPGGGSGAHITPNGQKWAITYTPYADNGDCRDESTIKADIAKIAEWGYTTIRVYSVDCGVFEHVVPACEASNLKIIYGVFLDAANGPDSSAANEQLKAIIDGASKDNTAMIIIGNEYVFNGGSMTALVAYVKKAREQIYAAGFPTSIGVTTTETVGVMETPGNEVICEAMDYLTVQIHPYFDQNTDAASAGDFARSQLDAAAKVCPEAAAKGKYITEIGWPHSGSQNGKAVASPEAQVTAITSIVESVGDVACLLSYADDGWKSKFNDKLGVETSFGCGDIVATL